MGDGSVKMMDADKLTVLRSFTAPESDRFPCTDFHFSPLDQEKPDEYRLVTASATGDLNFWSVNTKLLKYEWMEKVTEPGNTVHSVHYSHTGNRFASAGMDKTVRMYDCEMNECINEWGPDNDTKGHHTNQIFCVRFHPTDDRCCVTGGWDSTVKVWDMRQPTPVRSIFGPHLSGRGLAMNSRHQILTASDAAEDSLQLWDFRNGKLIQNIDWNGDESSKSPHLYCANFSADETMFSAAGSRPAECQVFDSRTFERLSSVSMEPTIHSCAFSNSKTTTPKLVMGGANNALSLYRIR
jgi:COMPASS component SWD3